MTRKALFILLGALTVLGMAAVCGAVETPEDWRVDDRRPDGLFGDHDPGNVEWWRADHRRPGGDQGDAASTVKWWIDDHRRPGHVPMRDTDLDRVEWWRVDHRRPADWPREAVEMVTHIDSDGDGVIDDMDRCPNTPRGAKVDEYGCPRDSDGDGVYDGLDRCPNTPRGAKVDSRGCPMDSDGDGVYDGLDQCPDTPPGDTVDDQGCTISEMEAELLDTGTLRLENVYFDTNKATLKPESNKALNEAGEILAKWSQLRIEVAGHTDSRGADDYNLDLSHRRAKAVLDYLVRNFSLDRNQLSAKGYGETSPVAGNATAEGRAQNRRVELRVLNREVLRK